MEVAPPKLGPLVRRSVHHGAAIWFVADLQFLVAMVLTEYAWTYPYSLTQNYVSDLGNTACGPWPDATSAMIVCSPWHTLFNVSIAVLGVGVLLGALLVKSAFPSRRTSQVGLSVVILAGIGAVLVGVFPENVYGTGHTIASVLAILVGGIGVAILALAMFRDTRWAGYRAYTLFSGLVTIVAFVLLATGNVFGLGPGGMERLAIAPELLWLLLVSIHLMFIPAYAPKAIPGT